MVIHVVSLILSADIYLRKKSNFYEQVVITACPCLIVCTNNFYDTHVLCSTAVYHAAS